MNRTSDEVVLKDLSFEVMAAAFEVQNTLGPGFLEKVYENALAFELTRRGIRAETQREIQVFYKGISVGVYFADILVNDEMIIELKATESLSKIHEAQVLNYLKATGKRLGLLINFSKNRLEHKRFVV
jgi:GxxExxY protein